MRETQIKTEELLKLDTSEKRISVIVPVYNVDEYIDGCISSILCQSHENFELILVDDGSPDGSAEKCEEYALKDDRIIVLHKPNGGQGNARNSGMSVSDGDFVAFADSDDYIHRDYLKIMASLQSITDADIVQTKVRITESREENKEEILPEIPYYVENSKKAINSLELKVAPYSKLYRSDVAESIRFSDWKVNEDDATYYRFAYKASNICFADVLLYNYFQSPNSVMRNGKKDYPTDFIAIYKERINYFKERNEQFLTAGSYFRFCLVLMLNYVSYIKNDTNEDDLAETIELFRDNYRYCNFKEIPLRYRLMLRGFYFAPSLSARIVILFHLR